MSTMNIPNGIQKFYTKTLEEHKESTLGSHQSPEDLLVWLLDQNSKAELLLTKAEKTAKQPEAWKQHDEMKETNEAKGKKKPGKEELRMNLTCCITALPSLCRLFMNAKHDSDLGGQPQS